MLRSLPSVRDLSQMALEPKFHFFLSSLGETLPAWASVGLCSGYGFMLFRASAEMAQQ